MSEEKQKEIKTLKEWEESGKNWDVSASPGNWWTKMSTGTS